MGKPKYLVELFVTERIVVTVEASNPDDAFEQVAQAIKRRRSGEIAVTRQDGIVSTHFDEDYDFSIERGDIVEDD